MAQDFDPAYLRLFLDPLAQLRTYLEETSGIVSHFRHGVLSRSPSPDRTPDKLREESDKQLALLLRHSTVGLWGALESTIEDFVVQWLISAPQLLADRITTDKKIADIKIPIGEYELLD